MVKQRWFGVVLTGMVVGLMAVSGCSSKHRKATNTFSAEAQHIKTASLICREYARATRKEVETFGPVHKWAKKRENRESLKKKYKVTAIAPDTFESTRDHQPYMIEPGPMGPILHEQAGQNGKVYVTMPDGSAVEQTPSQVKSMTSSIKQSMDRYK